MSQAVPAPGDYDGDGTTDLAVVQVYRSLNRTDWLVRRTNGQAPFFWSFGVPGDALVTGRFFGDGKVYPGVVYVRDAARPLEWHVKNPQGGTTSFLYGMPGSDIPNQSDLDCDGITDITVVTTSGTSRIWHVALSAIPGMVQQRAFAITGDRLGTADVDGDGCAELIALRSNSTEEYVWYALKLFGAALELHRQWGLKQDIPLLPFDWDGDGTPDLAVARHGSVFQTAYIRLANGTLNTVEIGPNRTIPMTGKFDGVNSNFAWADRQYGFYAIRQSDGTPNVFPFGISSNATVRPDGTVVQPTDDGRFPASTSDDDDDDDGGTVPLPPGSCSRPRFPDGSGGRLWKPDREGGGGSGDATYLGPNSIRKVELFGSDGRLVETVKLRYYGGNGGRSVWDSRKSNNELDDHAPLTLRETYTSSCAEIVITDPHRRYD